MGLFQLFTPSNNKTVVSMNPQKQGGCNPTFQQTFQRPANTTAYTAGDALNNSATAPVCMQFGPCATIPGGTGYITKALITTNKTSIVPQMRLFLFTRGDNALTMTGDNVPNVGKYTNDLLSLGYLDFPALASDVGTSTNSYAELTGLAHQYQCDSEDSYIYGFLVDNTGHTPSSGQLWTVTLGVSVD